MLRHFPNSLVLTLAGKIASYWLHIIVQCTLNMVLVTHYTVYNKHGTGYTVYNKHGTGYALHSVH